MARPAPSPSAKPCRPWAAGSPTSATRTPSRCCGPGPKDANIVDFPIAGVAESKVHAATILGRVKPSLLISIERCGRTKDDTYLNMRSRDISGQTARTDYLFDGSVPSVGIGDGGNEIGMGNLEEIIAGVDTLPDLPTIATVDRLVIASVSNWGGYGLVAALSRLVGRNLLPSVERETRVIEEMGHRRGGGRHDRRRDAHGGRLQHRTVRGAVGPAAPVGGQGIRV